MNAPGDGLVAGSGIGEILVSSRSLAEYRAMFALTDTDLGRRVLDCPAGTAGFAAEVNAAGGDVTACDRVYAAQPPGELARRSLAETDRGNRFVREHPELYRWTFFADPDAHHRSRGGAGARFAEDIRRHPHRYIAGCLPHLPFADEAFELVLSSHLLFSYADRLSFSFHREVIIELVRVSSAEVRVFPLVGMGDVGVYPHLGRLRAELGDRGVHTEIVDVDYEFQAGGDQMLVCRRGGSGPTG